jgi:hypothetical protein
MKIFNYIWNLFFGSQTKGKYTKGGVISDFEKNNSSTHSNSATSEISVKDSVVLNQDNSIPNGDDFFVSNEIIQKEINTDKDFLSSENKPKKKRKKNIVGQKTLNEIKEYLIAYGSLDVLTCEQKFKVKSLHNFIWFLRKDGFVFKTEKIFLHNELGKKVEVVNYKLITKK